jgi:hypothetical protein
VSIENVKNAVRSFLEMKDTCEVLAFKGAWGVGKTYAWKRIIEDENQKVWPEAYAYVSLFGLESLSDLRIAILSNRYGGNLKINKLGAAKAIGESVPWLKGLSVGLDALAPSLIKDMLICFDDLERLNTEKLSDDQVMGFISNLKETAKCKVVLILNEEKLQDENHAYKRYREKVIDRELLFAPNSEEATQWGLPDDLPYRDQVKRFTVSLAISNVRILRRISNVIKLITPVLEGIPKEVTEDTIRSTVLLAWCYYDRSGAAPPIEVVNRWNWMASAPKLAGQKVAPPEDEKYNEILRDYGFEEFGELETAILRIIQNGYVEESGLSANVGVLIDELKYNEAESRFSAAWNIFTSSFDANEPEVVKVLDKAFRRAVPIIQPVNLNAVVEILRRLNRDQLANELIALYITEHRGQRSTFDLANSGYADQVTDPTILTEFAAQIATIVVPRTLREAVEEMAGGSLSLESLKALASAQPDDFYLVFKGPLSVKLRKAVQACLSFNSADAPNVRAYATDALKRIAGESDLNAARVWAIARLQ